MSKATDAENNALEWLRRIYLGEAVKLTTNDAFVIMNMLGRLGRCPWPSTHTTFALGDAVEKIRGSSWRGHVVGWYSTKLTPEGYAVESVHERGSVQIYPAAALQHMLVGSVSAAISSYEPFVQPPLTQSEIDGIGV
jgi:dihydrofolate reductase (trimethoprim resistance protein)